MRVQTWRYLFPPLPPVAMIIVIAIGLSLSHFFPFSVVLGTPIWAVLTLALALSLLIAAKWAFHRHHTTVDPLQAPSALVTTGIYRYTRNPMYLAMVLIIAAAGLYFNALWCWGMIPAFMAYLSATFIPAEEARLLRQWPEAFEAYKARVRCWI
ncbi:isoprenylcysteine carboxylmethyltransferase family protein [Salinivibrio sp. ES.052]|uniref:methyltransferase family protein n=1 Tax=Salinivibrio sp. ES.052 TaxID=1882823 RepID=UPI000927502E|nr:isoprenylcysteine carboxylmethyltransferase family protein [Salinivibrio sp. ES.052]SIN87516.1 Protein-S-isoprenylcysteine O-methyltransferase Ste14 [Salinivibrio sp. ES.052]